MKQHNLYIKRCLDIARLGRGRVAPNPIVGSVIVHNGRILSEGYHQQVGGAHAEIEALNKVKDKTLLKEASIYVSLEPCFHYGRTPPCVDSLLSYGFKEVVICLVDPDDRVMGKSIQKLKKNGVAVSVGHLKEEGARRNQFFICRIQKQRPYVILKYAQTSNHVFSYKDQQFWISNPYAKRLTHRWRSEVAAILVGTHTALVDNPRLDNRLYFGKSPLRIVLDRTLRINSQSHLYNLELPTLVLTETTPKKKLGKFVETIVMSFDNDLLSNLLQILYQKDIESLLVEGGVYTLNNFIAQNLWDEARVFSSITTTAPKDSSQPILAPYLPVAPAEKYQLDDNYLEVYYR